MYIKYEIDFDINTRPRLCEPDYRYNDWYNIILDKCPVITYYLCTLQKLTEQEIRSFYVYIGRFLYKNQEHDNWKHIPFILGPSGSGKSTINYLIKKFFIPEHIKLLSNNIERKFGLSQYAHTEDSLRFVVGQDLRLSSLSLEREELINIISGFPVTSHTRKGKHTQIWTANLFLWGPELPDIAVGLDVLRIFHFNNRLNKEDRYKIREIKGNTSIKGENDTFCSETGYLLHACNRAYRESTIEVYRKNIEILKLNDDITNYILQF